MEIGAFAIAQFSLRAIGPISFFTSSLSPLRKRNCTHCPEEIPVVPLTFTVKSPRLAFSVTEASLGSYRHCSTVGVLDCQQYR